MMGSEMKQTTWDGLKASLHELAVLRQISEELASSCQEIETALQATELYHKLEAERERHAKIRALMETVDALVREWALRAFMETNNRKPMPGIELKEFKIVDFDPAKAMEWCATNAPVLIKHTLDASTFIKLAPGMANAPVTIRAEMRPMISRNLSSYLCAENSEIS